MWRHLLNELVDGTVAGLWEYGLRYSLSKDQWSSVWMELWCLLLRFRLDGTV